MTREEAVEVIKDFVAYGKHVNAFVYKGSTAIPIEALNMAIEALEQEETLQNLTKPNKSDLIVKGAGEIKDGLYNIKDGKLFQYKANGGTVRTYQIVSADRPKGEWKETEHSTNENGFKKWIEIRCPFCGHEPVYENIDDMEFCPKCGADMRGGDTK